ncbi:MAG: serine protease [Chloroflexi bacterium]|nr:MAG: serine protease [Chloroflexota bacterium]MBL1193865.1 serine protease [Chloroflexota bacterium]NOH11159.1 serine protease [Chloroflexota bacterium]
MAEKEAPENRTVDLEKLELRNLYSASQDANFTNDNKEALGLSIPIWVLLQDTTVAREKPELGLNEIMVDWEPGLSDGPTSAKIAVVDYNGDTGTLLPPVQWSDEARAFVNSDGKPVTGEDLNDLAFHQLNVWGVIQRIISFFEDPWSMGRPLPWGFEGNRLLVLPHAGYGENAFYDRHSKSLQFYYYGDPENPEYTCLSHDIIAHEAGHAILDGIRPFYLEDSSVETGAFHEFIGDFTAMLIALHNEHIRHYLVDEDKQEIIDFEEVANVGEAFGQYVLGREYLRSAQTPKHMSDCAPDAGPHECSLVLTSVMYQIFVDMFNAYLDPPADRPDLKGSSAKQSIYYAYMRLRTTSLNALDYLPPADVRFADYARAFLRVFEDNDPKDARGLRAKIIDAFVTWEILSEDDPVIRDYKRYPHVPIRVRAEIDAISRSRAAAYRFLNDNREGLHIPAHQDIVVIDLYQTEKLDRSFLRLPRQIVLEYIWREAVLLEGSQFGALEGKMASLLCGGTLVFDERGNIVSWLRKPGTEFGEGSNRKRDKAELEAGKKRRSDYLDHIAKRIEKGHVGLAEDQEFSGGASRPVLARQSGDQVQFELAPHFSPQGTGDDFKQGGRPWQKKW